MAFRIALAGVGERRPAALIPDDHGAAAILALRDGALEGEVFQRVVLGVDGQALLAGNEARAAGNGPALQNAIEFKPQIEVEAACVVLLHAEAVAGRLVGATLRLRGGCEVPLLRVGLEALPRSRSRLTAFGFFRTSRRVRLCSLGRGFPGRRPGRPCHCRARLARLTSAAPPLLGRRFADSGPERLFEGTFFGAAAGPSASMLRRRASMRFTTLDGRGASGALMGCPACLERMSSTTAFS